MLWSSLFFRSVLSVVCMDRLPFYLCSKYGKRQNSAVLATSTRQEDQNQMSGVLQGRGRQGLSGGGGKPKQAEVAPEGGQGCDSKPSQVPHGAAPGRHRQCRLVFICARGADACRVRSKLLWFPNAHI